MSPKLKTANQMDIFKGQRRTDVGTRAKAGERFFSENIAYKSGYKKVENVRILKSALSKFKGVEKEIALTALRRVAKSKELMSPFQLAKSIHAIVSTKHPSVEMAQIHDVLAKLSKMKATSHTHKKIVN